MPRAKKQHLKRRADGRFACRYKDQWFYGNTEDEALAAREAYKRAEASGSAMEIPTVTEYALKWLPIAKADVKPPTYTHAAIMMEKLTRQIGQKSISDVTPTDIKAVFSTAFLTYSASYIKQAKSLYSSLFDAAVADGLCRINPAAARAAAPHKGTYKGHRAITPQERKWIETLCTDHRAHPCVMAMLYAGLRPQEAKALNIDRDVDFDADLIHVKQSVHIAGSNAYKATAELKTAHSRRSIPLFPPLKAALSGRHGPLISCANGKPITVTGWTRAWESYVNHMEVAINKHQKRWHGKRHSDKDQDVPPWIKFSVTPYDLRHSFVTWCRDHHVELHTVVEWAGHADSTMILRIYDEVSESRSKNEAEKLLKSAFGSQNGSQITDNDGNPLEPQG